MSLVEVDTLRVELTGTGDDIVDDVSFTIEPGEILGLAGESGSGKTTVGLALLGDARPGARIVGGSVRIAGAAVLSLPPSRLRTLRGNVVAYVPQDPGAALNPALRIGRQLREVIEAHARHKDGARWRARIGEVLEEVGLPHDSRFLRRYPHELSGGQQQRVCISMAFLLRPKVIVLDEPTTGLDVTTQADVLAIARRLCEQQQVAALYISHDLAVLASLADRMMVMYAGRVVEFGATEQIFRSAAHPYTRRLVAAVPDIGVARPLASIPGRVPAPGDRPAGCAFAPRCDHATDACRTGRIEVTELAPRHLVRCRRAPELANAAQGASRDRASARSHPFGSAILAISGLEAFYGGYHVLHDVSLELLPQECLALVGESGSGKTTLARCIIGLHRSRQGEVRFEGDVLPAGVRDRWPEVRKRIQYVFQNPYNSLNPRRSVSEIVGQPLKLFSSVGRRQADMRVAAALEKVSLPTAIAMRYPPELSGGECQRVAIARALACEPRVLICDEVTSALDVSVQASIIQLLRRLQEDEGLAMLFVTHDLSLVRALADRVIVMSSGRIVEANSTDAILHRPQNPYTRKLIADTPRIPTARPSGTPVRSGAGGRVRGGG